MNYKQSQVKTTGNWLQEHSNRYDAQAAHARSLAFEQKVMLKILEADMGQGTLISAYFNPINEARVARWD